MRPTGLTDLALKLVFMSSDGDQAMANVTGLSVTFIQNIRNGDMYSFYTRAFARGSWIPVGPIDFFESGRILFRCPRYR